ncbi:zinc finger protein 260-like [Ochlerotatus camptorhynchus]|uniref:zinc finger protein 260-like n=1 Tax=Ochlerotatus camptorhynchus TaxID=644619 RepID=UPI0031DE7726
MSSINSICPFEKQEVICKICEGTDGAMESIFCERNDYRLLNKIFKSTNVKVQPVCGILSPICEFCRTRIDQFDDNFQPRCKEYVVEKIISTAPDDDPFNCLDSCAVDQQDVVGKSEEIAEKATVEPFKIEPYVREGRISSANGNKVKAEHFDNIDVLVEIKNESELSSEEDCRSSNGDLGHDSHPTIEDEQDTKNCAVIEPLRKKKKGRPKVEFPLSGIKQPTKCKVCNKTVVYLKDHMRIHNEEKKFKCPHCDRSFSQSNNLIYHVRKHTGEKPFACDKCDKSFICKSHLLSHSRTHVNDQPFQCEICSRRFNQACNLTKHLRVHSGEKPYNCNVCSKAFMNLSNMKAHEKRHRGERNFTCEICSKGFYDNHHLERHMSVHSKEKHFKCVRCPKQFSTLEELKAHAIRHKDPMEVNSCDVCSWTFTSVHKLNLHLKSHEPTLPEDEPVRCETCLKHFKRAEQLELHRQRVHGDVKPKKLPREIIIDPETAGKQLEGPFRKPYRCEVCSREFNQAYNLKVHLKTHMLGEKLHSCDKCQRLFRRRDHLEAHQRKAECLPETDPSLEDGTLKPKLEAEQVNEGYSPLIDLPPVAVPDRQQIVVKYEIQNV